MGIGWNAVILSRGIMLYFKCQDIGFDCPEKFDADTKDELMKKIKEHFQEVHYNGHPVPKSMIAQIENAIKP